MAKPLVSIVIPVYNQKAYIEEAVDSALSQSYGNCEVIVHDNCSTDGTYEVLKKYRDRIRLYRSDHNRGMVGGWNRAIRYAKGDYIKFLASDDLLDPKCVQVLLQAITSRPGSVLAVCRRRFIDNEGNVMKTMGFADRNMQVSGTEYAKSFLSEVRENRIGEPTAVLYPRSVIAKAGGYDPHFSQFADTEYWLRLLLHGNIVYVDTPLCSFRVHEASNSAAAVRDGRFISETFSLIRTYYRDPAYAKVLALDRIKEKSVTNMKILDTLKNIKDLLIEGHVSQAAAYFRLLSRETGVVPISRAVFSHARIK